MSFKDILALAISLDADKPALRAAGLLAQRFEAHATALILGVHASSDYAPEIARFSEVLQDLVAGAQSRAAREHAKIQDWLAREHGGFETRSIVIEDALVRRELIAHARRADLTIVTRAPSGSDDRAHREAFEAVLFGSGRPAMLMPSGWRRAAPTKSILIGWNASREAARAVADALPLLRMAEDVVVATIDAIPGNGGHGPAPGADIAAHLARHGVHVRVNNLDGMGRSPAAALRDEAAAFDADLIVAGGYGHSRAEEWLVGGATRELTEFSTVPIFMSH
jgi:nucleotide-binding universal stress UspA family protein